MVVNCLFGGNDVILTSFSMSGLTSTSFCNDSSSTIGLRNFRICVQIYLFNHSFILLTDIFHGDIDVPFDLSTKNFDSEMLFRKMGPTMNESEPFEKVGPKRISYKKSIF